LKLFGHVIIETDPCKTDNGRCEQKCVNYGGQAICQCYAGFKLTSDGKTCEGQSTTSNRHVVLSHYNAIMM